MDRDPLLRVFHIEVMKRLDRYLPGRDAESVATLMVPGVGRLTRTSWPMCSVDR